LAIQKAELYAKIKKQTEELSEQERIQRMLKELSQDITTMNADALLKKLTSTIREIFKVDIADVRFFAAGKWTSIVVESDNFLQHLLGGISSGRSATDWVVKHRKVIAIEDYPQRKEFTPGRVTKMFGVRGFLAAPMLSRSSEVIGMIRALSKQPRVFTRREIDVFEQMANGAAIAVENSRLYQDLQVSNSVQSEFLDVMSHELRTPLSLIMGYTGLLNEDLVARGYLASQSALRKIELHAKALLRLINTIMEATHPDRVRRYHDNQEPVDICKLLERLKSENELPEDSEIVLIWHATEDLPVIDTDAEKLQRILQHLIDNAIKFTKRGIVTVGAEKRNQGGGQQVGPEPKTPSSVEFSVTDTGVGIPAENLPSIFDRFKQGDSSATRSFEGVGLGLYIAKKYADLLGGIIEVESKPGKGSKFTLIMPCEPPLFDTR
jgi:signal transduction histidine kinase